MVSTDFLICLGVVGLGALHIILIIYAPVKIIDEFLLFAAC